MTEFQDSSAIEEPSDLSLNECILEAIQMATRRGWSVAYSGEAGIQFVKRKSISGLWGWLSFALIFLEGIGLIFWIVLAMQYMMDRDQIIFLSPDELLNEEYHYHFGPPQLGRV